MANPDEPQSPNTSRCHRGRPTYSKNKSNHPIIISRQTPGLLRAHVLEVAPGCDVSACVANLSRHLQRCVCVLAGSGRVSNVTLRQASSNSSITFDGHFEILSIMGTFLPAAAAFVGLTVFLSGAQGRMVGGKVAGCLVAAGKVVVMASSFADASFERLPAATRRREVVVCRQVKLEEEEGDYCGVLPGAVAGRTRSKELWGWLGSGRQVGEK